MVQHVDHNVEQPERSFRILDEDDWAFWCTNGYVVVRDVVPRHLCEAVVDVLWRFLDADPEEPETWYRLPAHSDKVPTRRASAGMLEIYHHQAMWDVRQHPRVYDAFVDLLGTEHLWVTLDRANLNVPRRRGWRFDGFLHWDIDPTQQPIPQFVQGIVSLTDTVGGMGGLQVVPESFRRFDELAAARAGRKHPRQPDVTGMDVVSVESAAGDLVVWNNCTVHGTGSNRSTRPRLAQYVAMFPEDASNAELVAQRLESFRCRTAPAEVPSMRGDPRELELGDAPQLTALGERLLGLTPWM